MKINWKTQIQWETKREQLLKDVILDFIHDCKKASKLWRRPWCWKKLQTVLWEDPANIHNFLKWKRKLSPEKVESLLTKCWIK